MLTLTAVTENREAQLNFDQIAGILGNGVAGQFLAADTHGNAAWATTPGVLGGGVTGQIITANAQGNASWANNTSMQNPTTATAPGAAYATARQPSTTRPTMVAVTVSLSASLGGQAPQNRVYIGATSASVLTPFTGGFAVGQAMIQDPTSGAFAQLMIVTLTTLLPVGWYYSIINTTDPAAANSVALVVEITL